MWRVVVVERLSPSTVPRRAAAAGQTAPGSDTSIRWRATVGSRVPDQEAAAVFTLYNLFKFLHISVVIVWIGALMR